MNCLRCSRSRRVRDRSGSAFTKCRHALALAACTAAGSLTHYFFLFTGAGLVWL